MLKSILAVDSLAIQRSLTILEDRYRELLQIGERRFEAWEGETTELKQQLADQSEKLQQAQKARDEQIARVKGLEAELIKLKMDREGIVAGLQRLRHAARGAATLTVQ